jgi:hypothetical protein
LIKFCCNNKKNKFYSKNPAIFQKKGRSSEFLKYFFFFLDSCFTNVHTQKFREKNLVESS